MKVHRGSFLKLVTALAGGAACAKEAPPPEVPSGVEAPTAPAQAQVSIPPAAPLPIATAEALPVPAPTAEASAATPIPAVPSQMEDYNPAGKHACSELRCPVGHPFAEGMKVLMPTCRTIEARLTAPRFQRFMACMLRQNNTRNTCDLILVSEDPGHCLEGWASPKEVDATTAAVCAPIVQKCTQRPTTRSSGPTLSLDVCQKIMTVTRPTARKKMIDCTTEYCGQAAKLCHGGYG